MDEKKFNLDGPDGLAHYWHDLRKEERIFSAKQSGGESVMIWGAMSFYGLSHIRVVKDTMNSAKYCKVLEEFLFPFAAETLGERWVFQQDNASVHTSNLTKKWFVDNSVSVLDWPAKSPDLNIIENLWGVLARRVFKDGRQYSSKKELQDGILVAWRSITEDYLGRLYKSIPNKANGCPGKQGGKTKY